MVSNEGKFWLVGIGIIDWNEFSFVVLVKILFFHLLGRFFIVPPGICVKSFSYKTFVFSHI